MYIFAFILKRYRACRRRVPLSVCEACRAAFWNCSRLHFLFVFLIFRLELSTLTMPSRRNDKFRIGVINVPCLALCLLT